MQEKEQFELKFRLYDGSDIGPTLFAPNSTVAMVKERIVADWPKASKVSSDYVLIGTGTKTAIGIYNDLEKIKIITKVANDVKLASAGRILENNKTIANVNHLLASFLEGL